MGIGWPQAIAAASTAKPLLRGCESRHRHHNRRIAGTYEWQMTRIVPVGGEIAKDG
jgi:hypothetical protein